MNFSDYLDTASKTRPEGVTPPKPWGLPNLLDAVNVGMAATAQTKAQMLAEIRAAAASEKLRQEKAIEEALALKAKQDLEYKQAMDVQKQRDTAAGERRTAQDTAAAERERKSREGANYRAGVLASARATPDKGKTNKPKSYAEWEARWLLAEDMKNNTLSSLQYWLPEKNPKDKQVSPDALHLANTLHSLTLAAIDNNYHDEIVRSAIGHAVDSYLTTAKGSKVRRDQLVENLFGGYQTSKRKASLVGGVNDETTSSLSDLTPEQLDELWGQTPQ